MKTARTKFLILGDVFFSPSDQNNFFKKIRTNFPDYLVIANLEGSINFDSDLIVKKSVSLTLPKFKKTDIPANLFFSIVNNHITDFGQNNFDRNLKYLGEKAVLSTNKKIINSINDEKFIFLADKKEQCILDGTNFLNFSNSEILKIAHHINSAIVIVHGGLEYRKYPTPFQRALARKIIDYGAKMVIFHHSHIIGHYEYWNNKLIHYGLGNAYFSDTLNLHTLDKSISNAISFCKQPQILTLDKLDLVVSDPYKPKISIGRLTNKKYINFYKNKYKLEPSFRPRQLFMRDFPINIQFFLWNTIASFLVRHKLSTKFKSTFNLFFK